MATRKPKPLPSVTEAVKLKCKDMYFRYTSLTVIARETGVSYEQLKEWVYGSSEAEVIQTCWFDERTSVSEDEFLEIRARNRYQAQLAAAEAIDDTLNHMKLLRERKDKKGNSIPLSAYELQALTNNILNIQKINHVNEVSAPKRDELPANQPQLISSVSEVINMEAVAFALSKDKGILKLISKEGLNETEPAGREKPESRRETSEFRASKTAENHGGGGGASTQGRSDSGIESPARVVEATIVDSGAGKTDQRPVVKNERRKPEADSQPRVETARPEPGRDNVSGAGGPGGSIDNGESGFGSESDLRFTDPFEDEYS